MIDWDTAVLGPCFAVFGEAQQPSYTPPGGGAPVLFDGIFDDAHAGLAMGDAGDPEMSTLHPVMGIRTSQFVVQPAQGGKVTVPRLAKTYMVIDVQPDGHGGAKLILSASAP